MPLPPAAITGRALGKRRRRTAPRRAAVLSLLCGPRPDRPACHRPSGGTQIPGAQGSQASAPVKGVRCHGLAAEGHLLDDLPAVGKCQLLVPLVPTCTRVKPRGRRRLGHWSCRRGMRAFWSQQAPGAAQAATAAAAGSSGRVCEGRGCTCLAALSGRYPRPRRRSRGPGSMSPARPWSTQACPTPRCSMSAGGSIDIQNHQAGAEGKRSGAQRTRPTVWQEAGGRGAAIHTGRRCQQRCCRQPVGCGVC